jgi:hypothetical protein
MKTLASNCPAPGFKYIPREKGRLKYFPSVADLMTDVLFF